MKQLKKITLSAFKQKPETHETQESTVPVEEVAVGRTDTRIFWSVLLASLLVLTGMVSMISSGAIAMAAAIPVPMNLQAGTINGKNFHLYPGLSKADNSSAVGVTQMDCTINNLTITKQVQVPIAGTVNVSLTSGKTTPVNISGLTIDINSMGTSETDFQNMAFNTGNGLDINSNSTTMSNATISSPYLIVNSITLPGLSFSVGK